MKILTRTICTLLLFFSSNLITAQNDIDAVVGDLLHIADEFASPAPYGADYEASARWFPFVHSLVPRKFDVSFHANRRIFLTSTNTRTNGNNEFFLHKSQCASNANGQNAIAIPTCHF